MDELSARKNELISLISKKENKMGYYERKLEKVRKCRSSIKNILIYCPEAEYMDGVNKGDFLSVKNAAFIHLEKLSEDEKRYKKSDLERYRKELELIEQFFDIQERENLEISKSPYSNSFYLHKPGEEIGWDGKPEGSYRLSNHWSFDGHCESDEIGDYEIAIGKYCSGKYKKV